MLLDRLVLRQILPLFISALLMFVLLIEIIDLFANLVQYQTNNVPVGKIFLTQLYYLPKAVSFSLPIACLFAASLAVGNFYSNNELIVVFASGIPLIRFTTPLLLLGVVLSVGSFFFEEKVVIPTYRMKSELTQQLLRREGSFNNYNVAVRSLGGERIYYADRYSDEKQQLLRVIIVDFAGDGSSIRRRIDAERATWKDDSWQLSDVTIHRRNEEGLFDIVQAPSFSEDKFTAPPTVFRGSNRDIEEMAIEEARDWLIILQESGADYQKLLATYYSRFSFTLTPFIVILISCSLGGRFKKNVVLMSLLLSLLVAVSYYVLRSVCVILASDGLLSPLVAAWVASAFFLLLALLLFISAPT